MKRYKIEYPNGNTREFNNEKMMCYYLLLWSYTRIARKNFYNVVQSALTWLENHHIIQVLDRHMSYMMIMILVRIVAPHTVFQNSMFIVFLFLLAYLQINSAKETKPLNIAQIEHEVEDTHDNTSHLP